MEFRKPTYELGLPRQMVHSAGTHKSAFTTSTFSELVTNRRMPTGTYGGVRGWGREAPAYSIQLGMGKACFNKSGHKVEKSRDSQAFSKAFSH